MYNYKAVNYTALNSKLATFYSRDLYKHLWSQCKAKGKNNNKKQRTAVFIPNNRAVNCLHAPQHQESVFMKGCYSIIYTQV